MSQTKLDEFKAKVKAAHDAIDEFAESLLSGKNDWFPRNADGKMHEAVNDLVGIASLREIQLNGGPRDGMIIKTQVRDSIQVAYIDESHAVRCDPDAPKPWTEINTILYRSTNEWDEGREVYKPDWATVKTDQCSP